jgi:hypothetical protein
LIFEHSKNQLQIKATIKYIAPSSVRSIAGTVPAEYFLSDIAVLEVSEITDIEPLVLGESDAVQNLDEVILIGYPNGDYSITKGNINSDKYQGLKPFQIRCYLKSGQQWRTLYSERRQYSNWNFSRKQCNSTTRRKHCFENK